LSEAIVFGRRIIERISGLPKLEGVPAVRTSGRRTEPLKQAVVEKKLKLQKVMLRHVGLKRSAKGLEKGLEELKRQLSVFDAHLSKREEYEFANLLTCAMLSTQAALRREESRGGHYRADFPERDDAKWKKHVVFQMAEGHMEECIQDV
jgi:L-aspartate oxidase